jgi:hypothetical protein
MSAGSELVYGAPPSDATHRETDPPPESTGYTSSKALVPISVREPAATLIATTYTHCRRHFRKVALLVGSATEAASLLNSILKAAISAIEASDAASAARLTSVASSISCRS